MQDTNTHRTLPHSWEEGIGSRVFALLLGSHNGVSEITSAPAPVPSA
jgi:hypothetical protein